MPNREVNKKMHTQKIEKPCYIKSMGTFNTMPRPFKRCRDKEFFKKLVESNAYEYEYRQIRSDLGFTQGYGSLKILYFYDSAYAILEQRTAVAPRPPALPGNF